MILDADLGCSRLVELEDGLLYVAGAQLHTAQQPGHSCRLYVSKSLQ